MLFYLLMEEREGFMFEDDFHWSCSCNCGSSSRTFAKLSPTRQGNLLPILCKAGKAPNSDSISGWVYFISFISWSLNGRFSLWGWRLGRHLHQSWCQVSTFYLSEVEHWLITAYRPHPIGQISQRIVLPQLGRYHRVLSFSNGVDILSPPIFCFYLPPLIVMWLWALLLWLGLSP